MKLGILVNTDRRLDHILGLATAARAKNHEVVIFAMDRGARLMENDRFGELAGRDGISVSVCDHSARENGATLGDNAEAIVMGSQLNNAMMAQEVDRLIVL
ncbi:MAG: hypothetical protein CMM10_05430 [Rhodospirillaceae bacterium]|jgi:hypothetical protein|nr:hypothetical protein [Rhodospirillaceae bacterium]|tara:strand:+ start:2341 stop:2643 length:303 start_codon:yes stop_codon:yes gene_type:complete